MTYSTVADIAENDALRRRMTAAAAAAGKEKPYDVWVSEHRWDLASTSGWADAWEDYLASGPKGDPGVDPEVITDEMILSAVQAMPVAGDTES